MRKIKFKIEYVPLSDDRIERHKDFGKLMSAYMAHPKPGWKTRLFGNKYLLYVGGIITGAAVTSALWWNVNHFNADKISSQEDSASKTEQIQQDKSSENSNGPSAQQNASPSVLNGDTASSFSNNSNSKTPLEEKVTAEKNEAARTKNGKPNQQQVYSEKKNEEQNVAANKPIPVNKQKSKSEESPDVTANSEKSAPDKSVALIVKNDSQKNESSSETPLHKDSPAKSTAANPSYENQVQFDTLEIQSAAIEAKIDTLFSSLPADTSGKGIHVALPKIDLHDEWNASKNVVSNVADSIGKKTASLLAGLFPKDSSNKGGVDTLRVQSDVAGVDTSISSLPADTSKKGIHVGIPKIDLHEEWNALNNAADSIGKKTGLLLAGLFPKDTAKSQKPPEEIVAENTQPDSFKHRFAQVTFVTPMGSDGMNAKDYMHNLSFNILQGYNGALTGVEFGGLANVERGYVTGVQFGGLTNFVFGDVKGVQFGGLVNHGKDLKGVQFSGLVSSASGTLNGAQFSGITSFARDTFLGLQTSGVLSLAIANKKAVGWQIAGVSNVSLGDLHGGQIAGVANVSTKMTGTQIGVINVSKRISGFQLGLINVADSIDGDALGLLSISANGQHHADVFGSEILYTSVGLKLGSPHIYNIFAVGVAPTNNTVRLGLGLGVGGHFPFQRAFVNVDAVCWSIHNHDLRDWDAVNLWNQIRIMAGYQFVKGFSAYAGPTMNVHVYDRRYPSIAPYTMYQGGDSQTYVDSWIGFVVGLQFF